MKARPAPSQVSVRRSAVVLVVGLAAWFIPLVLVGLWRGRGDVLTQEAWFFSKAAVVTFGGAYAVLAYINQAAVTQYGWLLPAQMVAGLGLAESTPGPLIMVTEFVGFVGAYQHPGGLDPVVAGVLGAVVTTWATFAPCFLWIFLGAPFIEHLRKNQRLTNALSTITAAVVGVVLNLAVWFGIQTLFGQVRDVNVFGGPIPVPVWSTVDWFAVSVAAISFVGLWRFRWKVIPVVFASAGGRPHLQARGVKLPGHVESDRPACRIRGPRGRQLMRTIRLSALSLTAITAMLIAGAPAAVEASPAPGPTPPTFTPVGPIDANVLSMTADGSVLVGVQIFGGATFRWSPKHGTQYLGAASGEISISRDGSTIVADVVSHGHNTAAIWLGGTRWQSLGGYPGSQGCPDLSNAYGVSNGGSVVVGLGWDDCDATGFRWDATNGMVSLGSLGGNASRANDVNADGSVIVGWDDAADGSRRGARWVNGVESLLSPTGVFLGGAEAVTPNGSSIVGGNAGPLGNQAYRWKEKKGAELLGKLPGGGGLAGATAFAVTDNGKVVVGASGAAARDAFVWTKATGMFNFQDYLVGLGVTGLNGWRLDTALAVSSDGTKIAGWGINPDGHVQSWLVDNLPPFSGTTG